ncbi:hypothetical protein A6769_33885 [Nostoc punctiforme NIES-2108]|uniref:Uncharacterized protein n=1 Tax=Nostoc punctiforme NIES-2108 TaxID=1356359 RepID=A0A367R4G3_NOSPU|nr:hypothetical protein A6769_33885 [Nostoc punctiforme NIES-2108]
MKIEKAKQLTAKKFKRMFLHQRIARYLAQSAPTSRLVPRNQQHHGSGKYAPCFFSKAGIKRVS